MDEKINVELKEIEYLKKEEFLHITHVRLYLTRIIERDLSPAVVEFLMPHLDYLIRSVWEAEDRTRSNTA